MTLSFRLKLLFAFALLLGIAFAAIVFVLQVDYQGLTQELPITETASADQTQDNLAGNTSILEEKSTVFLSGLIWKIFSIFILTLACAVIVSHFLAKSVTQPIQSLVSAAKRIAKGNYRQVIRLPNKNELGLLGQTLNIMQGAINQREEHILYQAQHDLLTSLPNREYVRDEIKTRLNRDLSQEKNALCILQVSNLNQLSDVYGTDVKDELLVLIAKRLKKCVNQYDIVARIASNELLLFFNVFDPDIVDQKCQKIFSALDNTYRCGSIDIRAITKIGLAYCPEHGNSFDDLLRRAYIALSHCHQSTNRYSIYQPGEDIGHLRKINITSRLQHAIRNDGFELVFHPQFDFRTKKIKQCEVLIRWTDEELGPVYPNEFIPLAEHTGDIVHITHWVFDECMKQLLRWKEQRITLGLCINLSPRDILNEDFIQHILTSVKKAQIDHSLLIFEITETAMIENPDKAVSNLHLLSDNGFKLAMDDFGTGFSSLNQLKTMPLHELKIDKSFIVNLENDVDDQKIVKASIEMAHNLGLSVVAEGVQTSQGFTLLKFMSCDVIQGFYLTKPLPLNELEMWLKEDLQLPRKAS